MNDSNERGRFSLQINVRTVLLLVGVLAALIGIALTATAPHLPSPWKESVLGIGVGLLTGGILEVSFEVLFERILKDTVDRATRETVRRIEGEVREITELVRGATRAHLVAVLPPRRDKSMEVGGKAGERTIARIAEHLEDACRRAGTVHDSPIHLRIAGVSLREYFDFANSPPCFQCLHKFAKSGPAKVHALLMYPGGDAMRVRLEIERDNEIANQIQTAYKGFLKLRNTATAEKNSSFEIEVRFYDFLPQAHLLITDTSVFLEQYHSARKETLKGLSDTLPDLYDDDDPCVGGRMPVLESAVNSPTYLTMLCHFDDLWNGNIKGLAVYRCNPPTYEDAFRERWNLRDYLEANKEPVEGWRKGQS